MAQNMYCSKQKATNEKYREEYDRIFKKEKKDEEKQFTTKE
jgi:hypothetical protein